MSQSEKFNDGDKCSGTGRERYQEKLATADTMAPNIAAMVIFNNRNMIRESERIYTRSEKYQK